MAEFAAIPERAIADRRLKVIHWNLLAIIARHDRFSKNGIGCVKSSKAMAAEIGANHTNVSAALGDLRGWKYIDAQAFPLDRRRFSYRVLYEEPEEQAAERSFAPEANDPERTLSARSDEIVCPEGKQPDEIVCPVSEASPETSITYEAQYIPRSGNIKNLPLAESPCSVAARAKAVVRDTAIALTPTPEAARRRGFAERSVETGEVQHVAPLVIDGSAGGREIRANEAAIIASMRASVAQQRRIA